MPEVGQPWKDTVSVTDNVPVAPAIKAALANIQPIVRNCSVCGEQLPAGVVKHPQCRRSTE